MRMGVITAPRSFRCWRHPVYSWCAVLAAGPLSCKLGIGISVVLPAARVRYAFPIWPECRWGIVSLTGSILWAVCPIRIGLVLAPVEGAEQPKGEPYA